MFKILDGNSACAQNAYLFSEIAAIYPITPSSPMASEIDSLANKNEKNLFNDTVKVIEMQSEAGAAGTLHGALISGSLATTFTASQGLLLMIPNMYKIAGECLPGVIHVAARTVATHALSIFGDHSDIYATRQTGFCILASSNVTDAHNLAAVAHLSAIKGSLPFLHFFDGFRTSHEVNKIKVLDKDELLKLVDYDKIKEYKKNCLNVDAHIQKGMAENEDIYFQSVEARNNLYHEMPNIVDDYMQSINALAGTNYHPFNYYGDAKATVAIVAMGSVTDTIKLVIDDLNQKGLKLGLIEVHLYRPFSKKYLLRVLPKTVKRIAVLDRTKEAGSIGEPLYLDVCAALSNLDIKIVGGRYGLSSKNTTPSQIYAVYEMLNGQIKNNFTIGINDDVTNLSLPSNNYSLNLNYNEIRIYGFGSDGMVSTSKDIIKTIGTRSKKYVQAYDQYDSKKSGGVTICHLRVSDTPIHAPFYVTSPDIIVVTKQEYFHKFKMLSGIRKNGILIINTHEQDLNSYLPNTIKKRIIDKNIKIYTIDADKIASDCGIKGKISKIMEMVILHILDFPNAQDVITKSIEEKFNNKGDAIIDANIKAISQALDNLQLYNQKLTINDEMPDKGEENIFTMIENMQGDTIPVSSLIPYRTGTFPGSLSRYEKRDISTYVPKWIKENCIECGQCALVCPHSVIRPFVTEDKSEGIPLLGNEKFNFTMQVSERDCTSCGLCIKTCPHQALEFGLKDEKTYLQAEEYFAHHHNPEEIFPKFTPKGSQFNSPKFEFSGACAGCGEAPYIKLLTQLFGDELVIANATGCSSIYGGSVPNTPYAIPWANSLFEDNAEFGYGMLLSYKNMRHRIADIMQNNLSNVDSKTQELFTLWLQNQEDFKITYDIKNKLDRKSIPEELNNLIDYIPARSVWAIGGDGWAYDIGFGGIDHVLSSNEHIRILVLDTEVYSNTGGQSSKSTQLGAIAEFAGNGKKTIKKDLFKIAMSYPNCYVANISLGANFMQSITAFKEANENDGPSIIIAYCPCVEQGIKGGMCNSREEESLAVQCGYINLLRYKPNEEKLYIDNSEPDFNKYHDFLMNEVRYNSLYKKNQEAAEIILENQKEEAKKRYAYYQNLANK